MVQEYVSKSEVARICDELGISDWTQLKNTAVSLEEAAIIRDRVGGEAMLVSVEEFRNGLEVELEHGFVFDDANVTNNHPLLTGMIVLAHLKEMLDYYTRLEVAEIEGDMLKALAKGDSEKLAKKYRLLLEARGRLAASEQKTADGGS